MKKVLFQAIFYCLAASTQLLANDLNATVLNCNSIHALANVVSEDQKYVYVLESLTSVGLWSSQDKIIMKGREKEVKFSDLTNGVYRITCVLTIRDRESNITSKTTILSSPLTIGCSNANTKLTFSDIFKLNNEEVVFYPNPVNNHLQISVKKEFVSPESVIVIRNITGQVVIQETLANQISLLNLSEFTSGMYFISLYKDNISLYNNKFLVQHN
jgi:hypothetical protein